MGIFVTSDLHLGHANIIKYCNRPFEDVKHMNSVLIHNWNKIIKPRDKVIFLGDLSFRSMHTENWISKLNGDIIFVKGNHDRMLYTQSYKYYILKYKGYYFYMTHSPYDVPGYWNSYVIHGHKHNNDVNKYPFYNKSFKRFNVSVELTQYAPLNMDHIIDIIGSCEEKKYE